MEEHTNSSPSLIDTRDESNTYLSLKNRKDQLITGCTIEMVSPACHPGADRWSAKGLLSEDISQVLPYINAEYPKAQYDKKVPVLLMKEKGKKIALRPWEISTAPVEDRKEAREALLEICGIVNRIWERRDSISPDYDQKTLPTVMEIYRELPRTNCKECGYPTCMAFAAALREEKVERSCCPYVQ